MFGISVRDLHYWELVLIQMYRCWRQAKPTKAIAEHRLAIRLRSERIYPLIDNLFRLFGFLCRIDVNGAGAQVDELSRAEILLLELVSCNSDRERYGRIFLTRNRGIDNLADSIAIGLIRMDIFIRNIRDMTPSEEERLERAVAKSYQAIFRMDGPL